MKTDAYGAFPAETGPSQAEPEDVSALRASVPCAMKPSLAFLRKVEAGDVRRVRGYTVRKGGYDRFIGGEKQWARHYRGGFVSHAPLALMGRPGVVELTEKGRAAIAMETQRAETENTGSVAKP